ncbi:hypothetical protein BDZ94DRAFT_1253272 [Collybia nuda]|uniref:Uncharacterized protein n=1 Tax=Collybia nuda TaxID=64659 RepID=A0A9P5YBQ5_9AGAR|nr:hypothetical protein BDZ94DRAFT_1253272 [Collybia nuda]
MSQLQELTRFMVAAGGAKPPGSESTHLLYNEDSSLILKEWNGTTYDSQELIASDALPDSPAVYLLPPDSDKRIVYINSSLALGSLVYDEESEEWAEDEEFGQHEVHPDGKLVGTVGEDGDQHIFFQDQAKNLVHLDDEWTPTILPATAATGSSLAALAFNDKVYLFYTSANDNTPRFLTLQDDDTWTDAKHAAYTFEANETPKRFLASPDTDGALDLYVLTEQKALFRVSADGKKTTLGTVTEDGEWKPTTKEECFILIAIVAIGCGFHMGHSIHRHRHRRRRHC